MAKAPTHFRFWILDGEKKHESVFFEASFQSIIRQSKIQNLFDDPVRPRQHIRRYRQSDLLRRFQIDDELELHRLLDGQVGGRPSFENLVDISHGAPHQSGKLAPQLTSPPASTKSELEYVAGSRFFTAKSIN